MGNMGNNFCQGLKKICNDDGKSMGETDLTNNNNQPITKINNPYFFNDKTEASINDPKITNEKTDSIMNKNNKADSYVTSINSHFPAEEEQKNSQLFSKNENNNINNLQNMNNYYNNNYNLNNNGNYNYNNNSLYNSNEFSLNGCKNNKEEISARKITNLFRKLLNAKRLSHKQLVKEISQIPSSEYIIGLNPQLLNVNLAPEDNCTYLGTKFKAKKDGLGLEIFNNSNATYCGLFRNGKRVDFGKFSISNQIKDYTYRGEIQGIYAKGYGIISDKKKVRDYEGYLDNSMKSGYGIETYKDNSEYKGCFLNGKKEGIGKQTWGDDSYYEGEWKNNLFHGYGIYKFSDGSIYEGKWRKGKMNGFGIFTFPEEKKYFGFFKRDNRSGFGIQIWFGYEKVFIGFWENNIMDGYGKLISNDKQSYCLWRNGKMEDKYKKKEFYKKIKGENIGFLNYFQMEDYNEILKLINGELDE